jgi:hypothetical protein
MDVVARVKGILLTPKTEWLVIEREPGDPEYLFGKYVALLAAIGPIAAVIFWVGHAALDASALFAVVVVYLLAFVFTYIAALIIDALAPSFGGQKNFGNALKLSVYSYTPGWLAGILIVIPLVGFLALIALLYCLYLFWTGAPPLMKVPQGKVTAYTAAVVASYFVLLFGFVVILVGLISMLID